MLLIEAATAIEKQLWAISAFKIHTVAILLTLGVFVTSKRYDVINNKFEVYSSLSSFSKYSSLLTASVIPHICTWKPSRPSTVGPPLHFFRPSSTAARIIVRIRDVEGIHQRAPLSLALLTAPIIDLHWLFFSMARNI
jgi:hypothetical protein